MPKAKLGLLIPFCLALAACAAAAPKSSDYGQVFQKSGQSFEVVSFGSSEKDAADKAVTAATLYCKETGRGRNLEVQDRKNDYLGIFASPEQQKAALDVMGSLGEGVKVRKGIPIIGPSVSVKIDPSQTARDLAEDSFRSTLLVVCRP